MRNRIAYAVPVLAALLFNACQTSDTSQPSWPTTYPTTPRRPEISGLSITIDSLNLVPGIARLIILRMSGTDARVLGTRWQSDSPDIALITNDGMVTARKAGRALVKVVLTFAGGVEAEATGVVRVWDDGLSGRVTLTGNDTGWTPQEIRIRRGTELTWVAGSINWNGAPSRQLWLLTDDFDELRAFDMSGGSASQIFETPGAYRFCSGVCWDPFEYGVILVY